MYQQLLPIIAPVALAAALGFGWARLGVPFDRDFVTRVVMAIGAPCLVLQGIAGLEAGSGDFVVALGIGVAVLACCAAVGALVLRLAGQPLRSFLPPVMFGNAGNLGLPLALFAFGDRGLGLAVAFYLVGAVAQFTVGPLFQGREPAWRTLTRTPIIYAAGGGLALFSTGARLPGWATNSIDLLAGLAIPLMLLALGHALGSFRVRNAGVAVGVSAMRLGVGLAVGLAAVELLDLQGALRGVVIIQSTMPVAVFNFLLAARYDRDPEDVAGSILVSTVVSFLTLPALVLFALDG